MLRKSGWGREEDRARREEKHLNANIIVRSSVVIRIFTISYSTYSGVSCVLRNGIVKVRGRTTDTSDLTSIAITLEGRDGK